MDEKIKKISNTKSDLKPMVTKEPVQTEILRPTAIKKPPDPTHAPKIVFKSPWKNLLSNMVG